MKCNYHFMRFMFADTNLLQLLFIFLSLMLFPFSILFLITFSIMDKRNILAEGNNFIMQFVQIKVKTIKKLISHLASCRQRNTFCKFCTPLDHINFCFVYVALLMILYPSFCQFHKVLHWVFQRRQFSGSGFVDAL